MFCIELRCGALQVNVRILWGLMALGYEIGTIMKRTSVVYADSRLTVKLDTIEGMGKHFVQVLRCAAPGCPIPTSYSMTPFRSQPTSLGIGHWVGSPALWPDLRGSPAERCAALVARSRGRTAPWWERQAGSWVWTTPTSPGPTSNR